MPTAPRRAQRGALLLVLTPCGIWSLPWSRHIIRLPDSGVLGVRPLQTSGVESAFVSDIFHEVDEEVRRDQFRKLWERYGNYFVALCVLVIAGVGAWRGYDYWLTKKAAEAGAAFEAAVTLSEQGKQQEAAAAFDKIAASGTPGYRVLARLRGAAALAPTDSKAAVKAYDDIAADAGVGEVFQDFAAVRAGVLLVDTAPYADLQTRLEPLTADARTFRHTAREVLALSAWKAGDVANTKRWSDMITADPQTPAGLRGRVEVLTALLAANGKG